MITSKLFSKFLLIIKNVKKIKKAPIRYNKIVLFTSYKLYGPMMKSFLQMKSIAVQYYVGLKLIENENIQ